MADLSTVSPLSASATGLSTGIQNAGAIQGMMRTAQEAPVRDAILREQLKGAQTSNTAAELDLAQKQRTEEFLKSPWDPSKELILKDLDPEDMKSTMEYIKQFPTNQAGRLMAIKGIEANVQMHDILAKTAIKKANQVAAADLATYQSLLDDKTGNVTPEQIAAAKMKSDQSQAKIEGLTGDFKTRRMQVAMTELVNKPEYFSLIDKSPTLQMAFQLAKSTGDVKGFETVLNTAAAHQNDTKTPFEAYMRGQIAQGNNDYTKITADYNKLINSPKEGEHFQYYDNNMIKTRVFMKGKWEDLGTGAQKYKPANMKGTPESQRYQDLLTNMPGLQGMTLLEFKEMETNLRGFLPPFKSTSRFAWANNYVDSDALRNNVGPVGPGATGVRATETGKKPPAAAPAAPAKGKSYERFR